MKNFFDISTAVVVANNVVPFSSTKVNREDKRYVAVLNRFGDKEHRISVYDKWSMSYPFIKWGSKDPDLMLEEVEAIFKKSKTKIIDKRHVRYAS